MSNIDWSKAPHMATHAVQLDDRVEFVWAEYGSDGKAIFHDVHDEDGTRTNYQMQRSGWKIVSCRSTYPTFHQIPHWNGEGLPPVGVVCEANTFPDEWRKVEIVAHKNGLAVFFWDCGDDPRYPGATPYCGAMIAVGFRPLRTAEERATEQALREIEQLYAEGGPAAVYDAGYRKQVAP